MTNQNDPFKEMFGPVWDGSGVRGFSGEGYWYHPFVPGLNFRGSTLVTKTITALGTAGNMPWTKRYRPRNFFPDCIWIDWLNSRALNAVALSGPPVNEFLETRRWQKITDPFLISFMPVLAEGHGMYSHEVSHFAGILKTHLEKFRSAQLGIQVNITCPNAGVDLPALLAKAVPTVNGLRHLGLPVVVKLNLLVPPESAVAIARETGCAITIANTIPFGTELETLPKWWWEKTFPSDSPLLLRGLKQPGGLSGRDLLPLVEKWVKNFRRHDSTTHVNAGGGILRADDVDVLAHAGASSIFFASVAMLRPWRVRSIINRGYKLLG